MLNPDMMNPDMMNPDLINGALSDTVWTLTNNGNTTAAYDVRLFVRDSQVPDGLQDAAAPVQDLPDARWRGTASSHRRRRTS